MRKHGSKDAVYHFNHGIEVDFYIPDTETAIQVCYSMDGSPDTIERETRGLLKIGEILSCRRRIIITYEEEGEIERDGHNIEILPAWKFLLNNKELDN